jgi:hypothetical protein
MAAKKSPERKTRQPHQRKPILKGVKSCRGCPELYDELKKPTTVGLTPTALAGLDEISKALGISRSELIERIGRKVLSINLSHLIA